MIIVESSILIFHPELDELAGSIWATNYNQSHKTNSDLSQKLGSYRLTT